MGTYPNNSTPLKIKKQHGDNSFARSESALGGGIDEGVVTLADEYEANDRDGSVDAASLLRIPQRRAVDAVGER